MRTLRFHPRQTVDRARRLHRSARRLATLLLTLATGLAAVFATFATAPAFAQALTATHPIGGALYEGDSNISVSVKTTLPAASDRRLRIELDASSTAKSGDYWITGNDGRGGLGAIPNGANPTVSFELHINNDARVESDETLVLKLRQSNHRDPQGFLTNFQPFGTVSFTIKNGPRPNVGVVLSKTEMNLREDRPESFTVKLAGAPRTGQTASVQLSISDGADSFHRRAFVSTAGGTPSRQISLSYNATNWNKPQTVTVSSPWDQVVQDFWYRISARVNNYYYYRTGPGVSGTVLDGEYRAVLSPASLTMTEGGRAVDYSVKLSHEPRADETVSVTILPKVGSSVLPYIKVPGGQYNPISNIAFTGGAKGNWNQAQTVKLWLNDVDADFYDGSATIEHNISQPGARPTFTVYLPVTVKDGGANLRIADTTLNLTEGGASASHRVRLTGDPKVKVAVTATVPAEHRDALTLQAPGGEAGASATLTFIGSEAATRDAPADWGKYQTITVKAVKDNDVVNESVVLEHTALAYLPDSETPAGFAMKQTATVKVTDAAGRVIATPESLALDEDGAAGSYTLALSDPPSGTVTVTVTSSDTGAATATPATLTFKPGDYSEPQTVTVTPVDDSDFADESLTISHKVSGYASITTGPDVSVTVEDSDFAFGLARTDLSAREPASGRRTPSGNDFRARLDGPAGRTAFDVPFELCYSAGTASATLDLAPNAGNRQGTTCRTGTLRYTGAGDTTYAALPMPLDILADSADEPRETATLLLRADPNNALPANVTLDAKRAEATLAIIDRDDTTVTLALSSAGQTKVAEGGAYDFKVSLSRALAADEIVLAPLDIGGTEHSYKTDYTLALKSGNGDDTGNTDPADDDVFLRLDDRADNGNPVLRFRGTASEAVVTLTVKDDGVAEKHAEQSRVRLGPVTGNVEAATTSGRIGAGLATSGGFTLDVAETTNALVTARYASRTEGQNVVFEVEVIPAPGQGNSQALPYDLVQSGDFVASAKEVADRKAAGTITANALSVADLGTGKTLTVGATGKAEIKVATTDDGDYESHGSLTMTLGAGSGYQLYAGTAKTDIRDNDSPPVTLSVDDATPTEGSAATLTATVLSAPAQDLVVPIVTRVGGANDIDGTAEATDFTAPASITIKAGATSGSAGIDTHLDGDKDDDSFTVAIDEARLDGNYSAGGPVKITIEDDNLDAAASIAATPATATEGTDTEVTVTVTLDRSLEAAKTIPLTAAGSGTNPSEASEFEAPANIVIAKGATSASAKVALHRDADGHDEAFTVGFGTLPAGVRAGSPASAAVAITDDGKGLGVTLSVSPTSVNEGGSVTVTATLDGRAEANTSLPLALSAGATNPAESGDYEALAAIDIAAGKSTGTATLVTRKDADTDPDTLSIALGASPPAGFKAAGANPTVTIKDTGAHLKLTLGTTPAHSNHVLSVDEGGSVTVTATLDGPYGKNLVLPVAITRVTAEAEDLTAIANITIPKGQTSGTGVVKTLQDADKDDETFQIEIDLGKLPDGISAPAAPEWDVLVTILDDEAAKPAVTLAAVFVVRYPESGRFVGQLLEACAETGTTKEGTTFCRDVGRDPLEVNYRVSQTGRFVHSADLGEQTTTLRNGYGDIAVRLDDDAVDEPNGDLTITLLPAAHYTIDPANASVTFPIDDDDPTAVSLAATGGDIREAGGTKVFTVTLSRALATGEELPVKVQFPMYPGDGGLGHDFTVAGQSPAPKGVTFATVQDRNGNFESAIQATFTGGPGAARSARFTLTAKQDTEIEHTDLGGGVKAYYEGVTAEFFDLSAADRRKLGGAAYAPDGGDTVSFNILDDDSDADNPIAPDAGVSFSSFSGYGELRVREGRTATYTVVLDTDPGAGTVKVVPSITSTDTSLTVANHATLSPSSLTFNSSNWSTPQTVTIRALADDNADNENLDIEHAVTGYTGVDDPWPYYLTIVDAGAGLSVSPTSRTLRKDTTRTYAVKLLSKPSHNVTVAALSTDTRVATVNGPLTFKPAAWNTAQNLTITGVGQGKAAIQHTAKSQDSDYALSMGRAPVEVEVTSYQRPTAFLGVSATSVAEGGSVVLTATVEPPATADVRVSLRAETTGAGIAAAERAEAADFTLGDRTLTVKAGASSATTTLDIANEADADKVYEGPEKVAVHLYIATGADRDQAKSRHVITITDEDDAPTIGFRNAAHAITEGANPGTVTLTLDKTGATAVDAGVAVATADVEASAGSDYTALAEDTKVTFKPGETSKTLTVAVADDSTDDPEETFTVDLSDFKGAKPAANGTATVTITDNDPTGVKIEAPAAAIAEDGGKVLTVTLDRGLVSGESLPVALTFSGSAAFGKDYTLVAPTTAPAGVTYLNLASTDAKTPPTITFAGGNTASSASATLTLQATEDVTDEGASESVTVTLGALDGTSGSGLVGGAQVLAGKGAASFDITDDDAAPSGITLSVDTDADTDDAQTSVAENADPAPTVTVTASTGATAYAEDKTVSVTVGKAADSAASGTDYKAVPGFDITIEAGKTSGSKTFTLEPVYDELDEEDETISVAATSTGITIADVSITLTNSDPPKPEISVAAGDPVTEGADAGFTVTSTLAPAADLTVSLALTATGQVVAANTLSGTTSVVIPATETSVTLDVPTLADSVDEEDGSVILTLAAAGDNGEYTLESGTESAEVAVEDDDPTKVSLTPGPSSALTEGDANSKASLSLTLGRALGPDEVVEVPLAITSATGAVIAETDAAARDYLFSAIGRGVTFSGQLTAAPKVKITGDGARNRQGATIELGGTARDDGDEADETLSLTFGDLDAQGLATTLSGGLAAQTDNDPKTDDNVVPVTIHDDEKPDPPEIGVSPGAAVTEGAAAVFTLTSSQDLDADLSVNVSLAQRGAFVASTVLATTSVVIPSTGRSTTFSVATLADSVDEFDGSVTLTLAAAGNGEYALKSGATTASVAVKDDDATSVRLRAGSSLALSEGDTSSKAVLELVLSRALDAGEVVQLPLTLTTSTAAVVTQTNALERDYLFTATGAGVTFSGRHTAAPRVTITGDGARNRRAATIELQGTARDDGDSAHEVLRVALGTPSSTSIANGVVAAADSDPNTADNTIDIHILDDEDSTVLPVVSIELAAGAKASIPETGTARFLVKVRPAPAAPLAVDLTVSEPAGRDYLAAAAEGRKTVSVPTSGELAYSVPTRDDGKAGADGAVIVNVLAKPSVYRLGASASRRVAVTDASKLPAISVAWADPDGDPPAEGSPAKFAITAAPPPSAPLSVSLTVADTGAQDHVAAGDEGARTVTVPTGGKVAFNVATRGNSTDGADGSVAVTLVAKAGYRIGAASKSVMPIRDDDPTGIALRRTGANDRELHNPFSVSGHPISEAEGVAQVTVSLERALDEASQEVTVPLVITGATEGAHFTLSLPTQSGVSLLTTTPHSAQNPALRLKGAGVRHASLRLTAVENTDTTTRTLSVALGTPSASASLGGGVKAGGGPLTIRIANNDGTPVVRLEPRDSVRTVTENGPFDSGRLEYLLIADPLPTTELTVNLAWQQTGNFTLVPHASLPTSKVFAANDARPITEIVRLANDQVDEPHGALSVEVRAGEGYTVSATQYRVHTRILDNDGGPTVGVSAGAGITEGGKAVFTLTRGTDGAQPGAPPPSLRLKIEQVGDFLAPQELGVEALTFTGDALTTTHEVQTLADEVGEKNGKIVATLLPSPRVRSYSTYAVDYPPRNRAEVAVADDDGGAAPAVVFARHPVALEEGGRAGGYTAELATDPGDSATVTLTVTVPAAGRHAVSVQAPGGTAGHSASLTFTGGAQGTWETPQTITVAPLDDEDGTDASVTLTHAVSGYTGVTSAADVEVTVEDLGYGIRLHKDRLSVAEPVGKKSYGVSLLSKPTHAVTVTPTSSDAAKAAVSGAVTFQPSAWNTPQDIEVSGLAVGGPHIDHAVASTDSNYNGIADLPRVRVTVVADDRPAVSLSATPNPVPEATRLTLAARFDTDTSLTTDTVVPLTFTEGTAKAADYATVASITIPKGKRQGTATILVTNDNELEQPDETFTVALGTLPETVREGATKSVEVAIDDSADQFFVNLAATPNPVKEGADVSITATLNRNPRSDDPIDIPLVFTPGTAVAADYGTADKITIAANKRKGSTTFTIAQDSEHEHPDETFTVGIGALPKGFAKGGTSPTVEIAIDDADDTPRVATLKLVGSATVNEGASATLAVEFDKAFDSPAVAMGVPLTVTLDTAEANDLSVPATVTMPSRQKRQTFTVSTTDDWQYEGTETFEVALTDPPPASLTLGTASSVTLTIDDGPARTPDVRFDAASLVLEEGAGTAHLARIDKTADAERAITVDITTTDGGARKNTHYGRTFLYRGEIAQLGDADINSGVASGVIEPDHRGIKLGAEITDNDTDDPRPATPRTFSVAIERLLGVANIGTPATLTVRIEDDEPTLVTMAPGIDTSITEKDTASTAAATLGLARPLVAGEIAQVPLSFASGTGAALPGSDKPALAVSATGTGVTVADAAKATPKVTFSGAGAQTAKVTFTATAHADGDADNETIEVRFGDLAAKGLTTNLEGGAEARVDDNPNTDDNLVSITVVDAISGSTFGIEAEAASVDEGEAATFTISADPAPTEDTELTLDVAEVGVGRLLHKRRDRGERSFTFPADETSATLSLATRENDQDEGDEGTLSVTIKEGDGYLVASDAASASLVVADDEPTRVTLAGADTGFTEGDTTSVAKVTLTLSRELKPGETAEIPLVLTSATGAALPGSASPDFTLGVSGANATLAGANTRKPSVTFAKQSAGSGATRTAELVFTASNRDDGDLTDETIDVAFGDLAAAGLATNLEGGVEASDDGNPQTADNQAALTLEDDDGGFTLSVDTPSVDENAGATPVVVTATASESGGFADAYSITVSVGQAGDGARAGTDYDAVNDFTIAVPRNAASATGRFTLTPKDDNVAETGKRISVVGAVSGVQVVGTAIRLIDNEPWTLSLRTDRPTVAEITPRPGTPRGGEIQLRWSLDRVYWQDVTVPLVYAFGSAEATDVVKVGNLVIPRRTDQGTLLVQVADDDVYEGDETLTVSLGKLPASARFLKKGAQSSAAVTIDDVQDLPAYSFKEAGWLSVSEGAAEVALVRSKKTELPARVSYSAKPYPSPADGATAGVDFEAVEDKLVSIPTGDAPTMPLPIIDDAVDEPVKELFNLQIAGDAQQIHGTFPRGTSKVIRIIDDDPTPVTLSPGADVSLDEADPGSRASVTLTLARDLEMGEIAEVPLVLSSATGAALPDSAQPDFRVVDVGGTYASISGRSSTNPKVKFHRNAQAGTAQTATVTFIATGRDDGDFQDETIEVALGDLNAAGLDTNLDGGLSASDDGDAQTVDNRVAITLVDDEEGPDGFVLSVDTASVAENVRTAPTVTVTATVKGAGTFTSDQDITVGVGAADDGASSADYAAVADFTIRVKAGSTSATGSFVLDPTDDGFDEPNESLSVTGAAGPFDVDPAAVTITDDDPAPTLSLALTPATINEQGAPNASTVTASLDHPSGEAITLKVTATPKAPAKAEHFTLTKNTELAIAVGARTSTGTITITAVDDEKQGGKTIDVSATASGGYGIADPAGATLTIKDDEIPPVVVSLARTDSGNITEGAADNHAVFAVSLDRALTGKEVLDVPLLVSGTGIGKADISFSQVSGSIDQSDRLKPIVSFDSNSQTATFRLVVTDDATDEADETLTLALGSNRDFDAQKGSNVEADPSSTSNSFSFVIVDNDTSSVVYSMSAAPGQVKARGFAGGGKVTLTLAPNNATFLGGNKQGGSTGGNDGASYLSGDQLTAAGKKLITLSGAPKGLAIADVRLLTPKAGVGGAPSGKNHRSAEIDLTYSGAALAADDSVTVNVDKRLLRFLGSRNGADGWGSHDSSYVLKPGHDLSASFTIEAEGVTVSASSLALAEGQAGKTYSLVLKSDPEADVTITVASGNAAVAVDTDAVTTGDQDTLTFTHGGAGNWGTAQKVTLRAVEDGNTTSESGVVVSHTAAVSPTSNHYHQIDIADVTVAVTDAGSGVVVSGASLSVRANDGTETFTVRLKSAPAKDIVITPTITGAHAEISGPLTFTPSNWKDPQPVTVTGKTAGTANVSLAVTTGDGIGGDYPTNTNISPVAVTVDADDRPRVDLSIADADGKLAEGGSTDVTVTLTGGTLDADLTVPVTVGGGQAADYSWGGNIVIATGKTSNKASLSVTDDATDEPTETLTLALGTLPATVREGTATSVTLAIIDGDATSVTLARASGETGAIAENGGIATLTVTLDRALVAGESVSAPLAVSGTGITAGDYAIRKKAGQSLNSGVGLDTTTPNTAAAPAVVFTGAGSDLATSTVGTATLELVAQSDDLDEGASETLAVALGSVTSNLDRESGTGTGGTTASGTVSVAVTDDDSRGIAVSATTLDIDETDTASTRDDEEHKGTYTVVLESEPSGAVTIDVEAPANAPFTVSPATLTFDPDEWDDAQTVTVTAKNDDLDNADDERVATITHAVKASGTDYKDEAAASVEVTVADDDVAPTGIALSVDTSATQGVQTEVAENAQTAPSVTVTATVTGASTYGEAKTVRVTVGKAGDAAVSGTDYTAVAPFDITIPKGDRGAGKSFTLDPTDDSIDEDNETLTLTGASGTLKVTDASITITDDDGLPTLSLVLTPAT
ncbi:MAG: hypothetical protein OXH69_06730, partial [Acidobacteria bacterium]|nr:hypothetical protein [Acidobacteriota bacterium]